MVREKYLSLDFQLTDGDYQTFINRKAQLHPELEGFSDSTEKKRGKWCGEFLNKAD
ncbi:MAG: DUF1819 family protein [Saprospiraceae bacterium]|nr:DUF1819 family protein [Saprospiraceae bacterium]